MWQKGLPHPVAAGPTAKEAAVAVITEETAATADGRASAKQVAVATLTIARAFLPATRATHLAAARAAPPATAALQQREQQYCQQQQQPKKQQLQQWQQLCQQHGYGSTDLRLDRSTEKTKFN